MTAPIKPILDHSKKSFAFFERAWRPMKQLVSMWLFGLGLGFHGGYLLFNNILTFVAATEMIIGVLILMYLITITPNT